MKPAYLNMLAFLLHNIVMRLDTNPYFNSRFISYICSFQKPDVVPVFKYLLFCVSYSLYVIQHCRMDLSKNTKITFDHTCTYCLFMVCTWYMVWLGLLCLYRLALGCKGKTWI